MSNSLKIDNQVIKEDIRVKKVKNYEVLDTIPEGEFDTITKLIAEIFNTPIAIISFVDKEHVFIKASNIKIIERNLTRSESLDGDLDESKFFEDTQQVNSLTGKKYFINQQEIRFYVSNTLQTNDGFKIGTISAIDFKPNKVSKTQLKQLKIIANLIMVKLNNRILTRKTLRAHDERIHMLIHDLKNPMTAISLQAELIGKFASANEKAVSMATNIYNQSKKIVNNLNAILNESKTELGIIKMQKSEIDLLSVINQVALNYQTILNQNHLSLTINIDVPLLIFGDESSLTTVFEQLIDNAIKFSAPNTEIKINYELKENEIIIAITDEGVGILAEELNKIFIKLITLSSIPVNNQPSNGLGLSLAKTLIDLHNGKIWAESLGRNSGTTFYVSLPIK